MATARVKQIRRLASRLAPQLSAWRRHVHQHPEPSMKEFDTAAYIVEQLRALGIEDIKTGIGQTGVVGLVHGQRRKTIGVRADMDALELTEKNRVPYRSRRPGLMHACGHDGHVAGLLGVGAILHRLRDQLPGSVKLIFQPGEEGAGGARLMIGDGVLEDPKVSGVCGLHVSTDVEAGKVGVGRGYATAQVDDVFLTVIGKTGHAARPDGGVDAISVAAQILTAAQQFIGRHTNALDRRLLTIGTIRGGTRMNILADKVEMTGTIRSLEPESRERILSFVTKGLPKLAEIYGAKLKVRVEHGYPPAIDDTRVADIYEAVGKEIVGPDNVRLKPRPVLGGEDFAYFGRAGLPAAMLELGIYDEEKGFTSPGHSTTFDFDDLRVLPIGAAMLAETACRMLEVL